VYRSGPLLPWAILAAVESAVPGVLEARDSTNALIHLYRGELGRMTTYRVRLDMTTNWAVGSTAAIVTFGLGSSQLPHSVFALAFFLDTIFVWMEAQRFRSYEIIRRRVRLLEQGFYARLLEGESIEGDWRQQLAQSLREPMPPITMTQALSVRLRRNHLWLMAVAYLGWVVKLEIEAGLPEGAAIGSVPGSVVIGLLALVFAGLVVVSMLYRPPEEG
jgi:uncharacterized membrane protein